MALRVIDEENRTRNLKMEQTLSLGLNSPSWYALNVHLEICLVVFVGLFGYWGIESLGGSLGLIWNVDHIGTRNENHMSNCDLLGLGF